MNLFGEVLMLNKISLIFKCGLRRAFKRHLLEMNTIIILFIIDFFLIEGDLDISRILTGVVREKKDYDEIKFPSLRIGLKKHYPFR